MCQKGLTLLQDADSVRSAIEGVSTPAMQYGSVGSSGTCDPTAKALANIEKANREVDSILSVRIRSWKMIEERMAEVEFLLSCVIALPSIHQQVITTAYYDEVKPWSRVGKKLHLSERTVTRKREEAFEMIADMWIRKGMGYVNLQEITNKC